MQQDQAFVAKKVIQAAGSGLTPTVKPGHQLGVGVEVGSVVADINECCKEVWREQALEDLQQPPGHVLFRRMVQTTTSQGNSNEQHSEECRCAALKMGTCCIGIGQAVLPTLCIRSPASIKPGGTHGCFGNEMPLALMLWGGGPRCMHTF